MPKWKKGDPVLRPNPNPNILEGLNAISAFIGKSPNTTAAWIRNYGLPATKTPNGRWLTHKSLILQWMYAGYLAETKNTRLDATEHQKNRVHQILGNEPEDLEDLSEAMGVPMTYEEMKNYEQ